MKAFQITGAAIVALLIAGTANAVQIRFDFSGMINSTSGDISELGQPMSGYVMFETEGLESRFRPTWPSVGTYEFGDWPTTPGPIQFSGGISVAGNALPMAGVWNEGRVGFLDACIPDCVPGFSESFGIGMLTRGRPATGLADGRFYDVNFLFIGMPPANTNYFDITPDFDPSIVLTLPLYESVVLYDATIWDCVQGECTEGYRSYQFNLDTVTRSTTSVPEPGTFGLLGIALAGMYFVRRTKPTPLRHGQPA